MEVPEGISLEQAAGLFITWPTSYAALKFRANVQQDEWVLVHAGAGGVGICAIQIAKAMGAPPGMMWHHCWIPRPDHGDGRPTVHLTGTVQAQAEALGITHWHLSLSHDGDVATAYVVAERRAAEEEPA